MRTPVDVEIFNEEKTSSIITTIMSNLCRHYVELKQKIQMWEGRQLLKIQHN